MRKNSTLAKIITKVNRFFIYDSPLGRQNVGSLPTDKRIFDCKVPMIKDGAYDVGGAYWGANADLTKELRVSYTKDLTYIKFYREE